MSQDKKEKKDDKKVEDKGTKKKKEDKKDDKKEDKKDDKKEKKVAKPKKDDSDEDDGRIAKLLKAAMEANLDDDPAEEDDITYEEYKQREIEKMKAEGWVIEGEGPPPDAQGPGVPGGPPRKPAPPPPPRTSVPGMFSKVEYDTSHMWNQHLAQDEQQEEEKEEEIPVDFTGTKVAEKFEILEQIGSGVTSVIRRVKPKDGGHEFVLKVVTHETNTLGGVSAKNTLKNLKLCQHEHVVKLLEEFQEGDNLYLVLEKLPGTAVNVLKKSSKPWTQKHSCQIITQILKAVVHIHSKGLTHSDLSPSNVLAGDESVSSVKIGGFSKCISGESDGDLFCEASLKPPEVIDRKKHGQSVDLWALGCLTFLFISGKLPFKDSNVMRLNQTIRKGTINFDPADWDGVDEQAKELVKGFLAIDPAVRLTAAKALENSWIISGGSDAVLTNFTKNLITTFA